MCPPLREWSNTRVLRVIFMPSGEGQVKNIEKKRKKKNRIYKLRAEKKKERRKLRRKCS